jgi:hypothetical protein
MEPSVKIRYLGILQNHRAVATELSANLGQTPAALEE